MNDYEVKYWDGGTASGLRKSELLYQKMMMNGRGARKLTGENLEVVLAEFSTLS
jgi:hypothetical protein